MPYCPAPVMSRAAPSGGYVLPRPAKWYVTCHRRLWTVSSSVFHLAVEPDDHVVLEDLSVGGDRAKPCPVDSGLHGAPHHPRRPAVSDAEPSCAPGFQRSRTI